MKCCESLQKLALTWLRPIIGRVWPNEALYCSLRSARIADQIVMETRSTQKPEFPRLQLMGLPGELRQMIWEALLITPYLIKTNRPQRHKCTKAKPIHVEGTLAYEIAGQGKPDYITFAAPIGRRRSNSIALPTAIFQVNTRTHQETTDIFYTRNRFLFSNSPWIVPSNSKSSMSYYPAKNYPSLSGYQFIHDRYIHLVRHLQYCYRPRNLDLNIDMIWQLLRAYSGLRSLTLEIRNSTFRALRVFLRYNRKSYRDAKLRQAVEDARQFGVAHRCKVSEDLKIELLASKQAMVSDRDRSGNFQEMVDNLGEMVQILKQGG